ncbi:MAG TPA: DotU family type IV/VI secretion system protein [Thermoanaerobaculia bacterium]|nr:DotU family type IV/VI secretion system protein [Thermoanaerobaculia bacterium]
MAEESFLLAAFRELYHEVIHQKALVAAVAAGSPPAPATPETTPAAPATPETLVNGVQQALLAVLERQGAAAARGGGYGSEIYREAQYVMTALADESFLYLDWPGRDLWRRSLLESRLFGSHRAGEAVFERLDSILSGRDPIYADLARVYLLALALGFAGRYRGPAGAGRLETYRRDLFAFVANRDPELLRGTAHLFPEAYGNTLDEGESQRLPNLRRWIAAAVLLIALWLGTSYWVWRDDLGPLEPLVQRVLTLGKG